MQTPLESVLSDALRKEAPRVNVQLVHTASDLPHVCANPVVLASAVAVFVAALLLLFPPAALGSPPSTTAVGTVGAGAFAATFFGMVALGARV